MEEVYDIFAEWFLWPRGVETEMLQNPYVSERTFTNISRQAIPVDHQYIVYMLLAVPVPGYG